MTTLMVLAKEPVPGRVKTRLCPPCTPPQAAALAQAALEDTFAAVIATPASRHVCVLDGSPGSWLAPGIDVIPQRGEGLDERLAAAFDDVGGPAVLIGMDTPQVTAAQIGEAMAVLERPGVDAVFGGAPDGGYWLIGLRHADPRLFLGIPMSVDTTGEEQLRRLRAADLIVEQVPPLRDVDTIDDARLVAAAAPTGRFAAMLAQVGQ